MYYNEDEEAPFVPKVQEDTEEAARFDYEESAYRDKGWAIFFIVHLVGIFAAAALTWKKGFAFISQSAHQDGLIEARTSTQAQTYQDVDKFQIDRDTSMMLTVSWTVAAVAAAVFSCCWLVVMTKNADRIVKLSVIGVSVGQCIVAGVYFALGMVMAGGLVLLFLALLLLYYYCVQSRIPFTQAMLKSSLSAINANKAIGVVAVGVTLLQIVWIGVWVLTAISVYAVTKDSGQGVVVSCWIFLLLSCYWTSAVLSNIAHVTVAGTVASWWMVPTEKSATASAFKRSVTTSFGSICLGSLIVAILDTLRAIFRQLRAQAQERGDGGGACLACCLECCVSCIEDLVVFINKYAYTQVAIYGKSFMEAARDTWTLLTSRGWDLIINDDLTGLVLACGMLAGGFFSALVASAVAFTIFHSTATTGSALVLVSIVGFLLGVFLTGVAMAVVSSAVATTFVVWAQCPNEIAINHPDHSEELRLARNRAGGAGRPGRY